MIRAHTGVLEQYGSGLRIELCVCVWAEERVSVSAKNTPATTNSNIVSDEERFCCNSITARLVVRLIDTPTSGQYQRAPVLRGEALG